MTFLNEIKKNPGLLPKLVIFIYRFGNFTYFHVHIPIIRHILYLIYRLFDLIFLKLFLNCDIPGSTKIGPGFRIFHPYGIVINTASVIGKDFLIRGETTIGNKGTSDDCPIIGDNVEVGMGARIIGGITIASKTKIGANAVVTKSCQPNSVLVGIPAHNIQRKREK